MSESISFLEDLNLTAQNCLDYGIVTSQRGEVDKAVKFFRHALELEPSNSDILANLGGLIGKDKDSDEARSLLWQAILSNPQHSGAWCNLGVQEHRRSRFVEARHCLNMARKYAPDNPDIWMNLSTNSQYQGDWESAVKEYEEAHRLRPNHADTLMSIGMLHMLQGDFDRGLPLYDYRHEINKPWPSEQIPKWLGQHMDLNGKKVLLVQEQGVGDLVMCMRYPTALRQAFPDIAKISMFCTDMIRPLLELWPGVDQFYSHSDLVMPQHDVQIAVLSMPRFMRLHGQPMIPPVVKPRLASKPHPPNFGEFAVGLCWRGNPGHVNDRYRSIDFEFFRKLVVYFKDAGAWFCSLQYGIKPEEVEVLDHAPSADFTHIESVKTIADMDLVITVDTAVGHIAGSLGIPTWILIPANTDWRWKLEVTNTEWYPSVKLYRMEKLPDWGPVFQRVTKDLRELL